MRKLIPVILLLVALLVGGAVFLALQDPADAPVVGGPDDAEETVEPDQVPDEVAAKVAKITNKWIVRGDGSVVGTVREYGTDRPIGGVEVALEAGLPGPNEILRTKTEPDGTFRITDAVNFDAWTLRVKAPAPLADTELGAVEVVESRETDLGVIYLTPGFAVPGIVVDERGNPVENALVRALRPRPPGSQTDFLRLIRELPQVPPAADTARTGVDGRFELSKVPPGRYDFEISADGFALEVERGLIITPEAEKRSLRFVIVRGFELAGRVVRKNGGSVEGLKVIAFEQPRGMSGLFELDKRFAITDESGEFLLEGLGAGVFVVTVTPEGEPFAIRDDVAIPGTEYLELIIEGDCWIEGHIKNDEQEPVAEAEVYVVSTGRDSPVVGNGLTDAAGYYRLDGLKSGPVQIFLVQADEYGTFPDDLMGTFRGRGAGLSLAPGKNEKDVTLSKGGVVRGVVVDQSNDAPIPGVRVSLKSPISFFGGDRAATTDAEGRFEIRSVPKGPGMLTASKDGWYQPGVTPQSMGMVLMASMQGGGAKSDPGKGATIHVSDPGQEIERVLKMATGSTVRGQVLSPAGEPVAGAQVELTLGGGGRGMMGQLSALFPLGEPRLTDAEGRFEMPGPPPGQEGTLTARAQGYLDGASSGFRAGPGEVVEEMVVSLRQGATLDGEVKDARGKPVEGALVRWATTKDRNDWQVRWELSRADPATTDGEGQFHAEQVEPGELAIQVKHGNHLSQSRSGTAEDGKILKLDFTLEIGGTLAGTVVGPDGQPHAGARVDLNRVDSSPVPGDGYYRDPDDPVTDSKGAFSVAGLAPGRYSLTARADGLAPSDTVEVETSGTEVTLRLAPAFEISGLVRYADGTPVAGVQVDAVRVTQDGENEVGDDRTNAEGGFAIRDVPAGTYELRINQQGWGPNRANVLPKTVKDLSAGQQGILVEVERGARIAGTVTLADGEPAAEGWVSVSRKVTAETPQTERINTGAPIMGGAFEVTGLLPGQYSLTVNVQGQARKQMEVEAGGAELSIELGAGGVVRGRILWPDGSPASGVYVAAGGAGAQTDSEGAFEVTGVPAGTHAVGVTVWNNTRDKTKEYFLAQERTVDVRVGEEVAGVDLTLSERDKAE